MKNSCIFNSLPNLMADLVQNKEKIIEYHKNGTIILFGKFFSRLLWSTV